MLDQKKCCGLRNPNSRPTAFVQDFARKKARSFRSAVQRKKLDGQQDLFHLDSIAM